MADPEEQMQLGIQFEIFEQAMSSVGKPFILDINYSPERTAGRLRSSKWQRIRSEHISRFPYCAVCGSNQDLEVHHIKPFHLFPDLELDLSNLVTLCEGPGAGHHLLFGHLLSFAAWNPLVIEDAKAWHEKIMARST